MLEQLCSGTQTHKGSYVQVFLVFSTIVAALERPIRERQILKALIVYLFLSSEYSIMQMTAPDAWIGMDLVFPSIKYA